MVNHITAQTLHKLYHAQQLYPHANPIPSTAAPLHPSPHHQSAQKTSLHSFWRLPVSRPPSSAIIAHSASGRVETSQGYTPSRCEDCDSPLVQQNADQDAMEVDYAEADIAQGSKCNCCGKRVCDLCAVTRESRVCLECATEGGV